MERIDHLDDPDAPHANSLVIATSTYVENEAGCLLMIRRTDNDRWSLPGGGMEIGETVRDCAVRETKEETGLWITVTGVVGIFTNPAHVVAYPDGEVRQQFSICLRAAVTGGQVATSDESRQVDWIDPHRLDDLDIHPEMRRRIECGLRHDDIPWID